MSYFHRILWPTLAGMALGFFVIQPLNVLVYNLAPQVRLAFHDINFWKRWLEMTTNSTSIFMGLAFSLLAGITGFWFGSWLYQRDRLAAERMESARRLSALETSKALMVTLAHYIRNANMVIGGFSDHLQRHVSEQRHKDRLQLIHAASREIGAVVDSLQDLVQIRTTEYIASGTAKMIDLQKEIEKRLAATYASNERH